MKRLKDEADLLSTVGGRIGEVGVFSTAARADHGYELALADVKRPVVHHIRDSFAFSASALAGLTLSVSAGTGLSQHADELSNDGSEIKRI
jgi:hypothetical protein